MNATRTSQIGFTIVELLIVIVVIAILASIAFVSYGGAQDKAKRATVQSDINNIIEIIQTAEVKTGKNLIGITGSEWTASYCISKPSGTDLAALPDTDPCISHYNDSIEAISAAAGIEFDHARDPWGRPYYFDENDTPSDPSGCHRNTVALFARPFNGNTLDPSTPRNNVPYSNNSPCE